MDVGGVGPVVVSADPEGCSSSSRLGSNATQLLGRFLDLFVVGPHPAQPQISLKSAQEVV